MKNRVIIVSHPKQEISVSKPVSQQQKLILSFLLLFVANEVQPVKALGCYSYKTKEILFIKKT